MGESDDSYGGITHGICSTCYTDYFSRGIESQKLQGFLDRLEMPVAAVDSRMQVLAVNNKVGSLLGTDLTIDGGRQPGDVFECDYALLPEGCGETVHCSGCTIRRVLMDTYQSGTPHVMVPAYLHKGDKDVRLLITAERVCDAILLRIDDVAP